MFLPVTHMSQIWFANEFVSVPCQNPINFNFLLENPQVKMDKHYGLAVVYT